MGGLDQIGLQKYLKQHSQEDEGNDKPGSQENSDRAGELSRGIGVGSRNTEVGMKEGRVSQPETAVRSES